MPILTQTDDCAHSPSRRFCQSLEAMTDTAFRHWQAGRRHSGPLYLTVQALRNRYCIKPKAHGCGCQEAQP